ncbi:hypothetical protein [Natrinema hispanicum]|uniref:Uncharacterized protein n=1 Tax=Natrinema hispanicum TaxID=392421 RepID=A0A1I0J7B6_9EURY|nr:hypothetical protein [Natrinema hispanicum]SEU05088.1 hypothetical protein SAMN04488694_13225 [Natrinema hispanicum]
MSEPYGHRSRVLAGVVLVGLLIACLVWAGATIGDLTETEYPDQADVRSEPAAYVGDQVVLGGTVVATDPVVIATRASGYGRFTLEDADARLKTGGAPLERGDRVTAFGTLTAESTLAVERALTRDPAETRYMLVVSALGGLLVVGRFVRHWRVDRTALAFVPRERSRGGHPDDGPERRGARAREGRADHSATTDDPRTGTHRDQRKRTRGGGEPRA